MIARALRVRLAPAAKPAVEDVPADRTRPGLPEDVPEGRELTPPGREDGRELEGPEAPGAGEFTCGTATRGAADRPEEPPSLGEVRVVAPAEEPESPDDPPPRRVVWASAGTGRASAAVITAVMTKEIGLRMM